MFWGEDDLRNRQMPLNISSWPKNYLKALCFRTKCWSAFTPLKMAAEQFFLKCAYDSATPLWPQNLTKIALSPTISEILRIFHFQC